jgi:hypothetical protein
MSGITAQSATTTLASGSTQADNTTSGYVTKEQIVLGVTGSPVSVLWSLSKPYNSNPACSISDPYSLTPVLTPDKEGIYTISCVVDGATQYILRISAVDTSAVSTISSIHLLPSQDVQIPTPRSGAIIFFSSDSNSLAVKLIDGTVEEIQTA